MMDFLNRFDALKIISGIALLIITYYIFSTNKKWVRFSQGIKPLLLGILILFGTIVIKVLQSHAINIADILKLLLLYDSTDFGSTRLVLLAYIVLFYGLEVSLLVLIKKIRNKNGN